MKKFVAILSSDSTPTGSPYLFSFFENEVHAKEAKRLLRQRELDDSHFRAGGFIEKLEDDTQTSWNVTYGSDSCRETFGRDRPTDPEEADALLRVIATTLHNAGYLD